MKQKNPKVMREARDFSHVRFTQISTYSIWRQNNNSLNLQKYFWKKRVFWSSGYFACSIGNVSKETIEKYIQNQG